MSDKNKNGNDPSQEAEKQKQEAYWKELFGEEISKDLAGDLGINLASSDVADPAVEEEFDADADDLGLDATNVIPPEVKDVSAYTNGEATDFAEAEEPELGEPRERVVRFARRRRMGLWGGVMYAAFVLGLSTIMALVIWLAVDDILGLTKEDVPVEVTIPYDFTLADVAQELHEQGVINHPFLFRWYGNIFGAYDRIEPGVYQVRPVDFRAIIRSLNQRTGELVAVRVVIPEGRTMRETFAIIEEAGVATAEALLEIAETVAFDEFEFLADLPMTTMNRLEGYLFPDTYDFFLGQNPRGVIRRMLENFDVRMRQNDIYALIEESEFTLHQIVNIAAMIEGEMASVSEAPRISSVIHNRIRTGMHLNIDATIQYILPERTEFLTIAHTRIESPYNTYLHTGLPYGPVANPGVAAILAALNPEITDFLFYALHVDGHHHFTRNYAEHNAFLNTPDFVHFGWGSGGGE